MKYLALALIVLLSACGGDNQNMFQYKPDLIVEFIPADATT